MASARRNVECMICGRKWPQLQSQRGFVGGSATVKVWVCNRCFHAPEDGVQARQAAQEKAAARRKR